MSITTVLLDAGGVILDESEHEAARAEIIADVLAGVVPGYSVDAYHLDIEEAVRSFAPSLYRYVFWKHLRPDVAAFNRLYELHLDKWCERKPPLKLYPGVEHEIRSISRRLKLGIAGQYGREILNLLEKHGLLNCFANRLTQDDFTITKPDIRYYEQIAAALSVEPRQCIMVGDRIDNDIIPAKQLGMRTILVRTGLHRNQQPRIPAEMPDVELAGVQGLAEAIQRLAELSADGRDGARPLQR